jgi:hypothetical protein
LPELLAFFNPPQLLAFLYFPQLLAFLYYPQLLAFFNPQLLAFLLPLSFYLDLDIFNMSKDTDQLFSYLKNVEELLRCLPTNHPVEKLDKIISQLSTMLSLAKLHRDWQVGSSHGMQRLSMRRKMRNYFSYVLPHTVTKDTKRPTTKREAETYEVLRALKIRAQLLNSISFNLDDAKKLPPKDARIIRGYDDVVMKFLKSIWSPDFETEAKCIMKDANFNTTKYDQGICQIIHHNLPN